jgi:hypothetical protein
MIIDGHTIHTGVPLEAPETRHSGCLDAECRYGEGYGYNYLGYGDDSATAWTGTEAECLDRYGLCVKARLHLSA